MSPAAFEPEFIVVGSGAGGGTVAARLAEDGFRVLVLEAGGDPRTLSGANPISGGAERAAGRLRRPGFHPLSTENEALRWDFFVRHYANQDQQTRDPNYVAEHDGQAGRRRVVSARRHARRLHRAQRDDLRRAARASDWDQLADLTGDPSWRAEPDARRTSRRSRTAAIVPLDALLRTGSASTRPATAGTAGSTTERVDPGDGDSRSQPALASSSIRRCSGARGRSASASDTGRRGGPAAIPTTGAWCARVASGPALHAADDAQPRADRHARAAARGAGALPDLLKIELNALVTRVLFDERRAPIGVEYLKGERLYRAHANAAPDPGARA